MSGFDVYLVDISTEALERARSNMTDSLDHQVSKGKISEATRTAALDRISTGTGLALLSECDLVILDLLPKKVGPQGHRGCQKENE